MELIKLEDGLKADHILYSQPKHISNNALVHYHWSCGWIWRFFFFFFFFHFFLFYLNMEHKITLGVSPCTLDHNMMLE